MRLALALILVVTPSVAEMDVMERLQDCLGLRAEAEARSAWHQALCQFDQSCHPFELRLYIQESLIRCPVEAFAICQITSGEPCYERVDEFLEMEIKRIEDEVTRDRIMAVASVSNALAERSLQRAADELEAGGHLPSCPIRLDFPMNLMDRDTACQRAEMVFRFSRFREVEAMVEAREWEAEERPSADD